MALTLVKSHTELKNEVARILGVVAVANAAGSTRTTEQVADEIARMLGRNNFTQASGATRTQTQVTEEVGRILGLYGVGESTLLAADDAIVDDMVEDTVLDLFNRGLFSQSTFATIPQHEATHLAKICAAKLAQAYTQAPEDIQLLLAQVPAAEESLRLLQMDMDAVLDDVIEDTIMDLYNRGLFSQSTSATIPQDEAVHLIKICASRVVTNFNVSAENAQVIFAQAAQAERMLYRLQLDSDTIIGDRLIEMLMELSREGLIMFDVQDTTAIDISSFRSIAEIIAASLADVFQVDETKTQRLVLMERAARNRLKRMVFDGTNDDTVTTEYF